MARKFVCPAWATLVSKGKFKVDPAMYVPEYLEELKGLEFSEDLLKGVMFGGKVRDDQCWLTVVTKFMIWDLERSVAGTKEAPESGGALVISVANKPEGSMKNYAEGSGEAVGISIARKLYLSVR